ncbi:MAG: acetyl-CoA carboxylase biotin carboxylase subunit [Bacteroidetes bacterium]|nr:acetyl-CoA carboxylase biotin carboxylase subunit [Bacteroidota bacterium]
MKKILVANRGEIALRILRTLREMGLKSVAVYSDADRGAPHVKYADEAVNIGASPSDQSYLNYKNMIEEAKRLKVDGIHPGYGFLSENASFAQAVEKAGLIFIGPSPNSIRIMGDKLRAKKAVRKFGIPMVPGTDKPLSAKDNVKKIAKDIGYPILIKAAAGGGGKGMRMVAKAADLRESIDRAASEAKAAFGTADVFIEKYIASPRHIEIQILGDNHGNYIHLLERDCTIQRRHQKVIEESPSPIIDETTRQEMGARAIQVAKACNYSGAGTVEFIVDLAHKKETKYYFLEMNTRLQVEHPVTEMITGLDLVKEQILIAQGKKLKLKQEDIRANGHAIELRVYAEDPYNNFLPDIGTLKKYIRPSGPGIRVDDGYEQGMDIPVYYDPLISKLITFGSNREEAIKRMQRAIQEYIIIGVKTTLSFGKFVMDHPVFRKGFFDTHFVDNYFTKEQRNGGNAEEELIAALTAAISFNSKLRPQITTNKNSQHFSKWKLNRELD